MMRRIWRLSFNRETSKIIDVEADDVSMAIQKAIKFFDNKMYLFKLEHIIKIELVSEPINDGSES